MRWLFYLSLFILFSLQPINPLKMSLNLFPHKYKKISAILYVLSFTGLTTLFIIDNLAEDLGNDIVSFFNAANNNGIIKPNVFYNLFFDEAFMIIAVVSGLVYAFSKEKEESETIAALRYKSLISSFIINYTLLLVLYLIVYGLPAYIIATAFIFTQLPIFIIHFRIAIYKSNRKTSPTI